MIQNGMISQLENLNVCLIPPSNKYARPGRKMDPVSLTIHETGNHSRGSDAAAHAKYFASIKKNVSCHFVVDDHSIYQLIPINEISWHAGDGGSGPGNNTSISIEMCINEDGDFEKTKEMTRSLVQYLMNELEINEVWPHKHWSGKDCPHYILKSGWNKFHEFLKLKSCKDLEMENIILRSKLDQIRTIIER